MALVSSHLSAFLAAGEERQQPYYDLLVEDGYAVAAALDLNLSAGLLTRSPDVIAGRLGHLKMLLGAWSRERRHEAYREEYAAALTDEARAEFEKGSESKLPEPEPVSEPEPLKGKPRRWRRHAVGDAAQNDSDLRARVPGALRAEVEQRAAEEGVTPSEWTRRTVADRLALDEALKRHPEREKEMDE